jgi:hypothetical protein
MTQYTGSSHVSCSTHFDTRWKVSRYPQIRLWSFLLLVRYGSWSVPRHLMYPSKYSLEVLWQELTRHVLVIPVVMCNSTVYISLIKQCWKAEIYTFYNPVPWLFGETAAFCHRVGAMYPWLFICDLFNAHYNGRAVCAMKYLRPTLGSWDRILLEAWTSVRFFKFVLFHVGSGLATWLIPRPRRPTNCL